MDEVFEEVCQMFDELAELHIDEKADGMYIYLFCYIVDNKMLKLKIHNEIFFIFTLVKISKWRCL